MQFIRFDLVGTKLHWMSGRMSWIAGVAAVLNRSARDTLVESDLPQVVSGQPGSRLPVRLDSAVFGGWRDSIAIYF